MKIKNMKYVIAYIAGIIGLSVLYLWRITDLDMPCIELDEYGYWSSGALFAGRDWSSVTTNLCAYYSYGYGILLSILIKIFNSTTMAYRAAIIANVIMIGASSGLIILIFKKLFGYINMAIIIASILCMLYPSTAHNSQFAWSEISLLFSFLISIYCLQLLIEKSSFIYAVLFSLSVIMLYSIHQRSIGVTGAAFIIVIFLIKSGKMTKEQIVFLTVTFILALCVHINIKNFVYNNNFIVSEELITSQESMEGNDFGPQILHSIRFVFSAEGIKCFMIGFLGKIYYMGIVSCFLVYEGVLETIKLIKHNWTKEISFIALYVISSLFLSIGIATVFLIYPTRIDTVLYGRYTDWIIPFFIALGIIKVIRGGIPLKRIAIYVILVNICLLTFLYAKTTYHLEKYFPTCAPAYNYFRINMNQDAHWTMVLHAVHSLIGILLLLYLKYKPSLIKNFIVFCIIAYLWHVEANSAIDNTLFIGYKDQMKEAMSYIDGWDDNIYYVLDKESRYSMYIGSLQFLADTRKIKCINQEQIPSITHGIFIINADSDVEIIGDESKTTDYFNIIYIQ